MRAECLTRIRPLLARTSKWLAVLIMTYIVSVGPAYRYVTGTRALDNLFVSIYRPIVDLTDQATPVGALVRWYLNMWGKDPPILGSDPEKASVRLIRVL